MNRTTKPFVLSEVETPRVPKRPLDFARGERKGIIFAASALLLVACGPAQTASEEIEKEHVAATVTPTKLNPAQQAYADANAKMHAGMGAAINADADVAFMQGMIPHHQGAVDMAKVVLEHGKDPETRALAEAVIKTQTDEIRMMEAWLAKRGASPTAASPEAPTASDAVDHSKMGH